MLKIVPFIVNMSSPETFRLGQQNILLNLFYSIYTCTHINVGLKVQHLFLLRARLLFTN
jgi:hypothetical protein